MKEDFLNEMEIADLKAGISSLLNEDKLEEARIKHFSKFGRLEEYHEYKKECENTIIFKLKEELGEKFEFKT
ncbi:MAG: hypothetical protein QW472_04535 [Candidatus Aenigmatarchaeota archaeon]